MKTNLQRRNFFRKAGAAAAGAALSAALPVTLAAGTKEPKRSEQSVSVSIHPMAVKREKRK